MTQTSRFMPKKFSRKMFATFVPQMTQRPVILNLPHPRGSPVLMIHGLND
jgi:hypothetical protein